MIGGPLCAVIEAQNQAALTTVEFIKSIGFDKNNLPIMVDFHYPKEVAPYQAASKNEQGESVPAKSAEFQNMKISVPFLTLIPIPFIRIEETTIDFNAKINSVETKTSDQSIGVKGDLELKQKWPGGSVKLNVSTSFQKTSSTGSKVDKTYSMQIHVRAVQDEMPAGMEKILGILETTMISTPIGSATEKIEE